MGHHEKLMSTLTAVLNKVSGENRGRMIRVACQDVVVESCEDVQLIVSMFYRRAIHDGCFHKNYAKVLKALHQTYPVCFESIKYPENWDSFKELVEILAEKQKGNFLTFVDPRQQNRLAALALMEFLGHLFLQGLWDPRSWLDELFPGQLKATSKNGELFQMLVGCFQEHATHCELYIECTCKLLEIIGGDGLDAVDASGCLKDEVAHRLNCVLSHKHPEVCSLGTRIRFLLEDTLNANWAKTSIALCHSAAGRRLRWQAPHALELRTDPADGKTYSLADLMEYYGNTYQYTAREIQLYFAVECKPVHSQPTRSVYRWQGRQQRRR